MHILRQALEIIRSEYPESFLKIHLHIFGDRPDALADSYEGREKKALGDLLGKRLILHQTIQGTQLAQELSTIPVLVAPSLEEMFGNQVIEAIMVGTWPIVTEQTAMAENVKDAGFGCCVAQKDPKQLASTVLSKVFESLVPSEATRARTTILARMGPRGSSPRTFKGVSRGRRQSASGFLEVAIGSTSPEIPRWKISPKS